jgi:hypothetical protein
MTHADSVYITPPTNTSAINHPLMFPPRAPTSQERADELLRRWRLARAAGVPAADRAVLMGNRELDPLDVLADLLGGADFDHEILDPDAAARLIIERLRDAGFEIVPTRPENRRR